MRKRSAKIRTFRKSSPQLTRRLLRYEILENRLLLAADFGDAPAPYPTLVADNGASHEAIGPALGSARDTEADGLPTASATGDDLDADADEDGIAFGEIHVGQLGATVTVTVANAPAGAKLDAWIDFNADGNWGLAGEQIFTSQEVVEGSQQLTFAIPSWTVSGDTYARFRLSTAGGLSFQGAAADGEVEDYLVTIAPPRAGLGLFGGEQAVARSEDLANTVVAIDLDRDGDQDLVSSSDISITWYENLGNQVFDSHVVARPIENGSYFIGADNLSVDDLDGDGDWDLLATIGNFGVGRVYWYENDGSQVFVRRTLPNTSTYSAASTDLDGDGDKDILISGLLRWLKNDGNQGFALQTIAASPDSSTFATAVDLDRDGDLDILAADEFVDTVAWYENDGSQVFAKHVVNAFANSVKHVLAADVDGDGFLDIVSASANDDKIAWYKNDGSQLFTEMVITIAAVGANSLYLADLEGDGDIDVLVTSELDDTVAWYINSGAGTFSQRVVTAIADQPSNAVAADIDGDGDLDVATATLRTYAPSHSGRIAWYEQVDNEVSLTVSPASVAEEGAMPLAYTFTRAGLLSEELTVSFLVAGQARLNADYGVSGATMFTDSECIVKFPVGIGSITLELSPIDDALFEFDESIALSLRPGSNYVAADSQPVVGVFTSAELGGDFGDAPASYPTLLSENGARHGLNGPTLGANRDQDADGVHDVNAANDDDGVTFGTLRVGQTDATVVVSVQNAPTGAYLNGWIDFNGDRSWDSTNEHAFRDVPVSNGDNQLSFEVPAFAGAGETFARFRLSTDSDLGPTGIASDGEVEDFAIVLATPLPSAGTFSEKRIIDMLGGQYEIHSLDFDGDGDLDFVTSQPGSDSSSFTLRVSIPALSFYENVGNATFVQHMLATDTSPMTSAVLDIDGDGDLDVVSARSGSIHYEGGITWHEYQTQFDLAIESYTPVATAKVATFNFTPAVRGNPFESLGIDVELDDHAALFSGYIKITTAGAYTFRMGSDDGNMLLLDGKPLISSNTDHTLDSKFVTITLSAGFHEIKAGYWDRFGYSGFSLTFTGAGPVELYDKSMVPGGLDAAFYSLGAANDGTLFSSFIPHSISSASASWVAGADLDSDGDQDIVAIEGVNSVWYENLGRNGFQRHLIANDSPSTIVIADEDGDGDLDLLVGSNANKALSWRLNDGNQNFSHSPLASLTNGVFSLTAIDLDDDGDTDTVFKDSVGATQIGALKWLRNEGSHLYTGITIDGSSFHSPSVADIDGDGDRDIVTPTAVFVNNGSELFTAREIFNEDFPSSANGTVGDVDGDGRVDLIAYDSDYGLYWRRNVDPSADFDGDNIVTGIDFLLWQIGFGRSGPEVTHADGDADYDTVVYESDLAVWEDQYGGYIVAPSADYDSDGDVDGIDFLAWQVNYGNTAATKSQGDADLDHRVGSIDLSFWESQYGPAEEVLIAAVVAPTVAPIAATVLPPEPAALSGPLVDAAMSGAIVQRVALVAESGSEIEVVLEPFQVLDHAFAKRVDAVQPTTGAVTAARAHSDTTSGDTRRDKPLDDNSFCGEFDTAFDTL